MILNHHKKGDMKNIIKLSYIWFSC